VKTIGQVVRNKFFSIGRSKHFGNICGIKFKTLPVVKKAKAAGTGCTCITTLGHTPAGRLLIFAATVVATSVMLRHSINITHHRLNGKHKHA
jgi:hypothetical protein